MTTAPEWLVTLLAEQKWKGSITYGGGGTMGAPPSTTIYIRREIAEQIADVVWAELERRMDEAGRSPNDPVYNLVPYGDYR